MNDSRCQVDLLGHLSRMPLMDRLEMVAMTGWSRGHVYETLNKLQDAGLVESVSHATELIDRTARFQLTAAGIQQLASAERISVDELLNTRPVSAQWRRLLLARIDAVASIYRLSATASRVMYPLRLRWYRAAPIDAAVELPNGGVVYIVRQGRTPDRTSFAKRMWRLWDEPEAGLVLLMVPDMVRLRRVLTLLTDSPVPAFAALEEDAAVAGSRGQIWHTPGGVPAVDLRAALERTVVGGGPSEEPALTRVSLPEDAGVGAALPDHMLPARLRPPEKRAMDLLFDWPWISRGDLADLMGISASRVSRVLATLEEFGLVLGVPAAQRRLALTDRALAVLVRRDRTSLGVAKRRWSVGPAFGGRSPDWRRVPGGKSRELMRNLGHTAGVHGFLASLVRQARSTGWEVEQIDPPTGASRYFRLGVSFRSVNPDAFGVLRKGGMVWPFLLEWERRAVRPVTMIGRLAPYLRYFSTSRPIDDHGVLPTVLVVFEDELAATRFVSVAGRELSRTGVKLQLLVSDRATVSRHGPLGPAWRQAGRWVFSQALPIA